MCVWHKAQETQCGHCQLVTICFQTGPDCFNLNRKTIAVETWSFPNTDNSWFSINNERGNIQNFNSKNNLKKYVYTCAWMWQTHPWIRGAGEETRSPLLHPIPLSLLLSSGGQIKLQAIERPKIRPATLFLAQMAPGEGRWEGNCKALFSFHKKSKHADKFLQARWN